MTSASRCLLSEGYVIKSTFRRSLEYVRIERGGYRRGRGTIVGSEDGIEEGKEI